MRWPAIVAAAVTATAVAVAPSHAAPADLTTQVNPLAGTLGAGFVQVAAGQPFGLATPGPATTTPAGDDPVNYIGYGYQDPLLRGFALNHFSGAGIHIGGELPFLPTTGAVTSNDPTQFASPYTHADEVAQPGYYAVTLDRYQTRAELTATPRVAFERYTFPTGAGAPTQGNVLMDVGRNNDGVQTSSWRVVDDRTVVGSVTGHLSKAFTLFFTARFDRPFVAHGTWAGSTVTAGSNAATGSGAGGWVTFDTSANPTVGVRVGMSWLSADGATANLAAEAPDRVGFDRVRAQAHDEWNRRLHAVELGGAPVAGASTTTFYTALYHSLLLPIVFDDADGRYLGFDGVAHQAPAGHHHYTDLSLWDTYRTQTPLLTLVAPDVAHDVGISLLDDADQDGGVVPQWVYANIDTGTMGGDSGTPTLAMLVADGALRGSDAERAWAALWRQVTTSSSARGSLADYAAKGYVPTEDSDISAPLTLEYAVGDAAAALVAQRYGTAAQATMLARRSQSWRNIYDATSATARPRNADGSWATPTSLGVTNIYNPALSDGWQEGTGYQWTWLVPQNPRALAAALGGNDAATQRLDQFFGTPATSEAAPAVPLAQDQAGFFGVYYIGNQYAPGNETDLQAPWLYDFLGQPASTARVVHAESQVFTDTPYGLPGNDDGGTMSAWYVLAALGLYQVVPGSPAWELSTPMFASATLTRVGTTLVADGAGPAGEYVASATLGHRPLSRAWVSDRELRGAALTYVTSPTPTDWGTSLDAAPPVVG